MKNLTFVPLAVSPELAVDRLPSDYLTDMYDRGRQELESALNVNVLGLCREISDPAPNKWFGSEMYLATLLSKIMERATDCVILDSRYLEALDKVKKCAKAPCWVTNKDSYKNQLYALMAHDAHKRMMKRFMTLPTTGCTARTIINDCQFQRGYLSGPDTRTEDTLLFWARIEPNHTINGAFWSEQAFRRMHRVLYEQSYHTFLRRGPFHQHYRNFDINDSLSQRYTYPQVVCARNWHENLGNRLRRLGVNTDNPCAETRTMSGWREATDLTGWAAEVPAEVPVDPAMDDIPDTNQVESRIHRSGITRQDMLEIQPELDENGNPEPTMLEMSAEEAAEAAREAQPVPDEAQPVPDEFTEACNNVTRQTRRTTGTVSEAVQNLRRLRREEWCQEMRTRRPEGEVIPNPVYHQHTDGLQNMTFDLHYTESGRMTREQIESQSEGVSNWFQLSADTDAEVGDESSDMDEVTRMREELNADVERECTRLSEERERNHRLAEECLGPRNRYEDQP